MFAIYTHEELCQGSKPYDQIPFMGHSVPHFNRVREALAQHLAHYPQLPLRKASESDYLTVHSAEYYEQLKTLATDKDPNQMPWLSLECRGYEFFLDAYLYGLGGFMEAIDRAKAGDLNRAYIFSLGGHHGFRERGHGYCILNPMAAAARYAQKQGFQKILILDWDVHHGDGTQSIFENDPDVYQISIHSMLDLYMGTQRSLKLGTTDYGEAVGQCNIPLLASYFSEDILHRLQWNSDFYRSEDSLTVFQDAIENVSFTPDLVFIFSGYDSHGEDQGKDITNWTNDDFQTLTRMVLKQFACPIISAHGGGYKLEITVDAALAHIEVLAKE